MRRGTGDAAAGLALVVMLALALGMGACASGSDSDGGATAEGGADGVSAQDVDAAAEGRPLPEQGDPIDGEPRIVYTANLRIQVDDPRASAEQAADLATDAGGALTSQDEDADDEVRLTVRVPSERFDEVLDDLAALGTVLDRSVQTEDVTDQVVDLQGRLDNARASTERLRALFQDAQSVDQIVAVEAALTEREAEVEGLAGQLQVLEDQADLSTISLTFTREGEPEVDDDIPGFLRGLENGWVAFRTVLAVAVTVVGFLLPFMIVVLPVTLVGRWLLHRRRRNRPSTPPVSTAPGYPPTPHASPGSGAAPAVASQPAATAASWPTPEAGAAEPDPGADDPGHDPTSET